MVYLVVAALCGAGDQALPNLVPAGSLALALSIWGFLRQGHSLLNGSALFCYGVGLFIAFPSIYVGLFGWPGADDMGLRWFLVSLSIGVAGMCVTMMLCRAGPAATLRMKSCQPQVPLIRPALALVISGSLLAAALALQPLDAALGTRIPQALGGIALFVLALGLADASDGLRRAILGTALLLSAAIYYLFLFSSFGRLVLGSIVCGILAVLTLRHRKYFFKLVLLGGTAPGLLFLAQQRAEYVSTTWNYRVPSDLGIASVVSPFVSLTKIVISSSNGVISPTWGSTIWASGVFWVPRQWWAGKPEGFGAQMVYITQPGNMHLAGFSDAATIFGEAAWNLGVLLIPVALLLIGLVNRWLDQLVDCAAGYVPSKKPTALRIIVLAVLLGGVLNLVWGGTFTFATRAAAMLLLLGLVSLLAKCAARDSLAAGTTPLPGRFGRRQDLGRLSSVLAPPNRALHSDGRQQVLGDDIG